MDPKSKESGREIVSTRVLPWPRVRVFQAWADPAQLARWWGPKGFTNSFQEFDLKAGGHWRFTMNGPNGANFQNHCVFLEVVPDEKIAFDHVSGPKFRATITFTDRDGGTLVTWRMLFETADQYEKVKGFAVKGNRENLDKLEAHLAV